MNKNVYIATLITGIFLIISCTEDAKWIITTESHPWVAGKPLKLSQSEIRCDVIIDTSQTEQTIEGFGACFNELGWVSLNRLKEEDRKKVFYELFNPGSGANLNICRIPVGANDFSRDWYSYNETDGDFSMRNFSIEKDRETLIPFILEAKKYNPDLKLWASPWSPPSWMKWNKHYACAITGKGTDPKFQNNLDPDKQGKEGTNMFIQEKEYFSSYALYFSMFVKAYRNEGIDIKMIMPQNEFNSCQIFPSCTWTSAGLSEFIGKYLGPELEKIGVDLFFGTMERADEALADTILNDPDASRFVRGVGFQWAGKKAIPGIHKRYPGLTLYQTEQECGNGKNDWEYCCYTWSLLKQYLENGANAYLYWNISLNKGGFSRWGWQQNSLLTVDPDSSTFRYNHEYYLLKHVSHFVKPGAKRLSVTGSFRNLLVFQNTDKSVICVMQNQDPYPKEISIGINGRNVKPLLPANSFATLVLN
jgi:glucosylceramidase